MANTRGGSGPTGGGRSGGGSGGSGGSSSGQTAGAESMAQTTSSEEEPRQVDPEEAVEGGSAEGTGADADVQFFDGTITKVDKDGNDVLSDNLEPGEQLRRATTERYAAVKSATRSDASADDTKKQAEKVADKAEQSKTKNQ